MHNLPNINPSAEQNRITLFIKNTFQEQGFENAAIGLSGGIDSSVSLSLLTKSLNPKNIFVAHLYYFESQIDFVKPLLKQVNIPEENVYNISIKDAVDAFEKTLFNEIPKQAKYPKGIRNDNNRIRLGNIMARIRMIILYDLAKKHNALVCGTENKSEMYLGYFTRFGDEASDLEPIQHLYKTQIYCLAKHLKIPQSIISKAPTAGLWNGQTDEGDFGFSYKEADNVLHLYFEKKESLSAIISKGFLNAKKIIDRVNKNSFKHHLPHIIK